METRRNRRRVKEHFLRGRHAKLEDLQKEARGLENQYLYNKYIPPYPRPEIHVSHLKHDTDRGGLEGIHRDGGFRSKDSLLWWSLAVKPEDITSAETRLLEKTYPDRTEDQRRSQQSFLGRFATSPAFLETSRLGSYRFTFPVEEVLEAYSQQFCYGAQPVFQVYETVLYKQEVMYVILVDTPERRGLPLLSDNPNAVCAYRDGRFIWRPEAMSEKHRFELVQKPEEKQMEAGEVSFCQQSYVWDHVTIALSVPSGEVLKFDTDKLRGNLKYCSPGAPRLAEFEDFEMADDLVESLWPNFPRTLKEERSLQEQR
ncbi:uncharacterized protein LOC131458548 isoform X2 [Solea solea]|uniref:uncharacterized protein LOC131458548 isoform X2 n=1 Tax=Solea solea TaxID=90069 RepID=UPI00272C7831|nr:uncharacterized protein LOC131458548 isoform X2 [Solea solea]